MQRSNTILLIAVAVGIAIMTVWRLTAEEIAAPPGVGDPVGTTPGGTQTPAGQPPERDPPEFDGPRVVVKVRSREQYVAPRPSRVQAVQLPHREPLPTAMLAGTGANPWAEALRPGVALVRIETDGGFLVRQVGVEATGVTVLGLGAMLAVTGRVQDEAGRPVVDARVWLGDLDAKGNTVHRHTDENGAFEVRVRASDGVPLAVWAPGHGATWRPIRVDVDGGRDHTITLGSGGTLAVQVAGQTETVETAVVFTTPAGAREAELSRYPFFLQGLVSGASVNAEGRSTVGFLPERGTLAITVVHPQVAIRRHREVRLDGERTECTVPLEFAAAWSATIGNDAGEPLAGAGVLLRPEGRAVAAGSGLNLLPPQLDATGCFYAQSDADGSFLLAAPGKGDVLSLRAPGHAGRDLEIGEAPPASLWLPKWKGGDLVVRLQPPIAGQRWRAEFDLGGGTVIDCEADQSAVVALPHAGTFDITVTSFVGAEQRAERAYRGVSATGPVDVPAPGIE